MPSHVCDGQLRERCTNNTHLFLLRPPSPLFPSRHPRLLRRLFQNTLPDLLALLFSKNLRQLDHQGHQVVPSQPILQLSTPNLFPLRFKLGLVGGFELGWRCWVREQPLQARDCGGSDAEQVEHELCKCNLFNIANEIWVKDKRTEPSPYVAILFSMTSLAFPTQPSPRSSTTPCFTGPRLSPSNSQRHPWTGTYATK